MIRELLSSFRSAPSRISEMIGRVAFVSAFWNSRASTSVDTTQTDYGFWDSLRRGTAQGYKMSGQLAQPIAEIVASYVLGKGVQARLADSETDEPPDTPMGYTNDLLKRFLSRVNSLLMTTLEDDYALGDQYLVVNPDGSLSVPSPETVKVTHDELDYRKPMKVTITTKLPTATVTDEYRLDGRTVTVHYNDSREDEKHDYQNLIGRLPIVHWANDRSANETNGRPIYESLLRVFSRYDDLAEKTVDGGELMGNPVPTFEGMEDLSQVEIANQTAEYETYTDADGNEVTRRVLKFDRDPIALVGKGGQFNFKGPQVGFTDDNRNVLKSLFLLILDRTRIPEFLWGGAIASSKASADAQYPPFVQFVGARRAKLAGQASDDILGAEAVGGIHELIDIWLRMRRLVDPRVVVGPVALDWPKLEQADKAIILEWVRMMSDKGIIPDELVALLSELVDNPAKAVEAARAENEQKQKAFDELTQRRIDQAAMQPDGTPTQDSGQAAANQATQEAKAA